MAASTLGAIANVGTAVRPDGSNNGLAASPNYRIVIDVTGDESVIKPFGTAQRKVFPITANLPERFHMELQSQWGMPFDGKTLGDAASAAAGALGAGGSAGMIGDLVGTGLTVAGVGNKLKSQSLQAWESSSALEMNFDLIFYAQENTEREIKERHLGLLKLVAPSTGPGGETLIAPGPRIINGGREGRLIDVYIGNYLHIPNCIIRSVGADVVTLFDESGIPIAMSINIAIGTHNACVTGEDLEEMFYGSRS